MGYLRAAFEEDHRTKDHDEAALAVIRTLGGSLEPIELPQSFPTSAISFILSAEAATAFDDLTRSNRDDLLTRQIANAWPNVFRQSRFIPAVEYLQANRLRTMLIEATNAALADIDVLITPSFGRDILLRTKLTGQPAVVVPSGFAEGTPASSLSFIGRLFDEESPLLLAVGGSAVSSSGRASYRGVSLAAGREGHRVDTTNLILIHLSARANLVLGQCLKCHWRALGRHHSTASLRPRNRWVIASRFPQFSFHQYRRGGLVE